MLYSKQVDLTKSLSIIIQNKYYKLQQTTIALKCKCIFNYLVDKNEKRNIQIPRHIHNSKIHKYILIKNRNT